MSERRILESWKAIAAYLGRSARTCRKWEHELGLPIHRLADSPKARVFAYADELDRWKEEKLKAERSRAKTARGFRKYLLLLLRLRSPWLGIPALLVFVGAAVSGVWYFDRESKIRWANNVAIPEIERLMTVTEWNKMADLALKAEKYIPKSPRLARLIPQVVANLSVETDPPGADVYIKDYDSKGEDWLDMGKSPVIGFRLSQGYKHWKIEKAGFETEEGTLYVDVKEAWRLKIRTSKEGEIPSGMVSVMGGDFKPNITGLSQLEPVKLGDYFLDKYEVTNRQYKEFIDGGGYKKKEYWKNTFIKDGRVIPWEEGIRELVDKTGRPGPSTWQLGDYPPGQGDYPVSGVSWYEASAYAEFSGKRLPTLFHWNKAALADITRTFTIPFCNLQGRALAPVGSFKSLGPFGTYDMAGNVKEWCWSEVEGKRLILGGAWNEAQYMFASPDYYPPFFRAENFGFRCLKPKAGETDPPEAYDPIKVIPPPDLSQWKPCSDEVFEIIKNLYSYTKTDLNPKIESQQEWSENTLLEKVSYEDVNGEERIMAYLFIPRRGSPPFQTIIFCPGGGAWHLDSIFEYGTVRNGEVELLFNRKGRAFVIPVLPGTFERRIRELNPDATYLNNSQHIRDFLTSIYQDMSRCLDYLETRPEFDNQKFVLQSLSFGAWMSPLLAALEKRFRAAIIQSGGLGNWAYSPARHATETDMINFAPRVKIPVLMQNGRYDCQNPLEPNIRRLFDLLGTPEKDKSLCLYETGHSIWLVNEYRKDMLDFLDKYLGPVKDTAHEGKDEKAR